MDSLMMMTMMMTAVMMMMIAAVRSEAWSRSKASNLSPDSSVPY